MSIDISGENQMSQSYKMREKTESQPNQVATEEGLSPARQNSTILFEQTNKGSKMKQVHFTLQGKGGVGKSLVASLIAQYLLSKGEPVAVIDADPVNPTLFGYDALKVQRLELME